VRKKEDSFMPHLRWLTTTSADKLMQTLLRHH
jgi:hypothetical protein